MTELDGAVPRSLWLDQLDPAPARRPALDGPTDVDVAIVGGGFSGLWTAWYLARLDPSLRVLVIEREHCGFGASGRNGGWCVGELAGSVAAYAARSTQSEAVRLVRAVFDAVDEVGRVADQEGIACGYARGGTVRVARTRPQAERQREEIAEQRELGFTEDEIRLLDVDECQQHLHATDVRSGILLAPSAVLDPARLVVGLAAAAEAAGVRIVEGTAAISVRAGEVRTTGGTVRAEVVVRATEAYTRDLPGQRRTLLPVYSLMIATEPLTDSQLEAVGLAGRPSFADDRFMVIYGQRTEDRRIAFGGRGVPYRFGSRIDPATETRASSHRLILQTLVELFPGLAGIGVTHRWGGVLAIPRNWLPGVGFHRPSGLGVLGGYVGEGVAASNLAGRTMAELITGADTERTSLPWVGVSSRRWEPEPFRWLGVRGSRWLLGLADTHERRTDRELTPATTVSRLLRGR